MSSRDLLNAIRVQREILISQLDMMIEAENVCDLEDCKFNCVNSVYALKEMCLYFLMDDEDE